MPQVLIFSDAFRDLANKDRAERVCGIGNILTSGLSRASATSHPPGMPSLWKLMRDGRSNWETPVNPFLSCLHLGTAAILFVLGTSIITRRQAGTGPVGSRWRVLTLNRSTLWWRSQCASCLPDVGQSVLPQPLLSA